MRKIKILTDSTCDLPKDIIEKYDIGIMPLFVVFGEENYRDGVDLQPEGLFKLVKEKGTLPKTAALSPYDCLGYFREYIDQDMDIIAITISSKISSTYQNALVAASEFPEGRIWVVDSQNITAGEGMLAIIAAKMAQEGKTPQEIVTKLEEIIPKVKVHFVIDTLEYLYKGGRCSALQNLLGTALKIRPIIGVKDGCMLVAGKTRGDKKKALNQIIDWALQDKQEIDFNQVFVISSLGGEEEAVYIKDCLSKVLVDTEIIVGLAGCVISCHCGEKTTGIIYIKK
ncbi:MAG TPA: DegV family protein [Peptococcaceae bacterium]|nr:DegV family protein [Peptococcaceae bacterium]